VSRVSVTAWPCIYIYHCVGLHLVRYAKNSIRFLVFSRTKSVFMNDKNVKYIMWYIQVLSLAPILLVDGNAQRI
jgi:hypothetical protein